MVNIYKKIGIDINSTIVETCAVGIMQIGADAERDTFAKLYPDIVSQSPFLGSRLNDYFLGGMNDMAQWVLNRWMTAFYYLENGGSNCTNTKGTNHNPIYWVCGNEVPILPPPLHYLPKWQQQDPNAVMKIHHHRKQRMYEKLSANRKSASPREDIAIKRESRSLKLHKILNETFTHKELPSQQCNTYSYFLERTYSNVGETLVKSDVNNDGYEDLIIGVPNYSLDNRFNEGRVFVVFGSAVGLPKRELNLETADLVFKPPFQGLGRFGFSVVVLDLNSDSIPDLVISAPAYAENPTSALYSGQIYIYHGRSLGHFNTNKPDITYSCGSRYCNFGITLETGDVNNDGKDDLLIGSPFSTGNFNAMKQNGMVAVYYSKSKPVNYFIRSRVEANVFKSADIILNGSTPYSWFGFAIASGPSPCNILIGAPAENVANKQMVGSVYCYNPQMEKGAPYLFANGTKEFQNFGYKIKVSHLNGKQRQPIVSIAAPNDNVKGHLYKIIPLTLNQSGTVFFYSMSPQTPPLASFSGDRHFSVFGHHLSVDDVNSDGFDDIFIGSPIRQTHLTDIAGGEAVGELYVYFGSDSFPFDITKRQCLGETTPCPGDQADKTFSIGENKAQFGFNAASLHFSNSTVSSE